MTHSHTKPLNSLYREIRVINNMYLNNTISTQSYNQLKQSVLAQVEVSHWPVVQNKFVV